MSGHTELWRQIVADRMHDIQEEARLRYLLTENTPRRPPWLRRYALLVVAGLGRALVLIGQQLQRMEEATNSG